MSLSNKILIIFFGTILAYTLMAFVEIRVKGDTRIMNEENSISESLPLGNVKYLSIASEFEERLTITSSSSPQLTIQSKSGQLLDKVKYELRNDTLFLLEFEEVEGRYDLTIDVPLTGFGGFSSATAYVYLSNIQQQSLSIIQTGGNVELKDKVILERLNITSSNNSYTEIMNSSIDTVSVYMDHSDLRLGSMNRVEGLLSNESDLFSSSIYDIQLKKDKSSRIRMY